MRFIFLGPPGTVRENQAATLSKLWQISHISTGSILRQAIADQTSLGLEAQVYVKKGYSVPDYLILGIICDRLHRLTAEGSWILDGFPRNLFQAQTFDQLLPILGISYNQVVNFNISTDTLLQQYIQRGCSSHNAKIIRTRIDMYQKQTTPLIEYYQQKGCLTAIDGDRPPSVITQYLQASLQVFMQ